jgi:hypothetical protein
MAIHKPLKALCFVHGCGSVAIESAQIHFETGGGVARKRDGPSSLYGTRHAADPVWNEPIL